MGLEGGCFGAKGSCGGIENALGAGYDAIKKEQRLAVFLFLEEKRQGEVFCVAG